VPLRASAGKGEAMDFLAELDAYAPPGGGDLAAAGEADDVTVVRELVAGGDPWSRANPVHVTGSAVVLHPPSRRVLLRWHERMGSWLHVGGHVDPGETSPWNAVEREALEETGLTDLQAWPDPAKPAIIHVAVVPVPAANDEPAHNHADVRYVLATARPDDAVPERPSAPLRWVHVAEARDLVGPDNLRTTLDRVEVLLDEYGSRAEPSP
jgi:8-oxo-dGTP pyrophosphatase MutT (NUDIX family)